MNLEKIISQKENFAAREVNGELILVPVKNTVADMNEMFTLNEVGNFIWQQLKTGVNIGDIASNISEEFEVEKEVAKQDLIEFLEALENFIVKAC